MTEKKKVKVHPARKGGQDLADDTFSPLVDIYETDSELVLAAELPGADKDTVSVQVDKGVLTIQAEAKVNTPGDEYSRTYVSFVEGQYFRAFALSDEIDRDEITASSANGVLTVRLPKAAGAVSRKIEIKT